WRFRAATEKDFGIRESTQTRLDSNDLLLGSAAGLNPEAISALHSGEISDDREMLGSLTIPLGPRREATTLDARILNFNLHQSPWRLRLTQGDESVEVNLHLTDAWDPTHRYIPPGPDGEARHVKSFLGTVEMDAGTQAGLTKVKSLGFANALARSLNLRDNDSFDLWVEASETKVSISSRGLLHPIEMEFSDQDSLEAPGNSENGYLYLVNAFCASESNSNPDAVKAFAASLRDLHQISVDHAITLAKKRALLLGVNILFHGLGLPLIDAILDRARPYASGEPHPNLLRLNVIAGVPDRIPFILRKRGQRATFEMRQSKRDLKEALEMLDHAF
ncbi:MAG: hypothetical protein AAB425_12210, partial [Bdellovibrionota bacterium]